MVVYTGMANDRAGDGSGLAGRAMKWHNDAVRELTAKYGITARMYLDHSQNPPVEY